MQYFLPRAYGPFNILNVTEHTVIVKENGIHNIISLINAAVIGGKVKLLSRINTSRTSLEDQNAREKTKLLQPPLR